MLIERSASEPVEPLDADRPRRRWGANLLWGLTGAAVVAATGAGWFLTREVATPPVIRLAIELLATRAVDAAVVSPDGTTVAYVGHEGTRARLFVRRLDSFDDTELAGTEGATDPFFSPDGTHVGFFADGELRAVRLDDEQVTTLLEVPPGTAGADWAPDGSVIVASAATGGLLRIPAGGGEPERLTTPDPARDERAHGWPVVLPDGAAVLFAVTRVQRATRLAALSLDAAAGERSWSHLLPVTGRAAVLSEGRLLYQLDTELLAVGFDSEALATHGAPRTIVDGVDGAQVPFGGLGRAGFSLSHTGTLVYFPVDESAGDNRLVWVSRHGSVEPLSDRRARHAHPRLSPDGRRVAVSVGEGLRGGDIWLHDVAADSRVPLTEGGGDNRAPVWSPDGRALAFASNRTGAQNIYVLTLEENAEPRRVAPARIAQNPAGWSRAPEDLLTYYTVFPGRDRDVWTTTLDGEMRRLLSTPFDERSPALSPDGRLLAYVSDETGRDGVHVRRMADLSGPPLASYAAATEPVWSRDGRELFMRVGTALMAAGVETSGDAEIRLTEPIRLFERPMIRDAGGHLPNYDVSPDGQRFVMIERADPRTALRIVLDVRGLGPSVTN